MPDEFMLNSEEIEDIEFITMSAIEEQKRLEQLQEKWRLQAIERSRRFEKQLTLQSVSARNR
jgi:hypothetical protein